MTQGKFEWDNAKDEENRKKHGVSFFLAQEAFLDPNRVIARDLTHSTRTEQRYFCFGEVAGGILTVRFSTGAIRSAYLAPAIREKVSAFMNAKIKYRDGPIGDIEVVPDFLPSPHELALQEETVKVTIALSRSSVEFFKEKADEHHTPYQKMIRKLLDSYVEHQKRPLTKQ